MFKHLFALASGGTAVSCTCFWSSEILFDLRASWPIGKRIQNFNNTMKHIYKCWKYSKLLEWGYTTFWKNSRTKTSFLCRIWNHAGETGNHLPSNSAAIHRCSPSSCNQCMFPVSLSVCQVFLCPAHCLHWAEACVGADCKRPSW